METDTTNQNGIYDEEKTTNQNGTIDEKEKEKEKNNNSNNNNKTNTWDRSWSLQELRDSTDHWTLANDSGLLHYLEEFSNKIINRTKDLESEVDTLVFDSKSADIKVHNTFNEFLMLANTQFVENRVYDEDETAQTPNPTDKADTQVAKEISYEELEAVLLPKYSNAIGFGRSALELLKEDEEEERPPPSKEGAENENLESKEKRGLIDDEEINKRGLVESANSSENEEDEVFEVKKKSALIDENDLKQDEKKSQQSSRIQKR